MTDIFLKEDLRRLLLRKKVVFIGDSNIRALYKDMLCLNHGNEMISQAVLKKKMEKSLFNDTLMSNGEKTNGRDYREERCLKTRDEDFSFYFITRVYSEYVEEVLKKITKFKEPDVIIINSCLWDICRWGPRGVEEYQENLVLLLKRLKKILSKNCLVIWITAPPLSQKPRGGFLLVQLEFLKYSLRFHVMEANAFAFRKVPKYNFDVLDIHFHLRMQLQRRAPDGIHWNPEATRYGTNMLLTHICLAWGQTLPGRIESTVMERVLISSLQEHNKENLDHVKNDANSQNEKPLVEKKAPEIVSSDAIPKKAKRVKLKRHNKEYKNDVNEDRTPAIASTSCDTFTKHKKHSKAKHHEKNRKNDLVEKKAPKICGSCSTFAKKEKLAEAKRRIRKWEGNLPVE